ncbi:MAG: tetratricopeptide repeat protein [Burkholderiales bacterium]
MQQDDIHSASVADWQTQVSRPRLISPVSLAGLILAVGVVLVLLFPQRRLSEQIRSNPVIDEVSLQYMRNLLATEPDNYELRLDMARDYAVLGQYARALKTLQPLDSNPDRRWREAACLAKLDILAKIAYATQPGSQERNKKNGAIQTGPAG